MLLATAAKLWQGDYKEIAICLIHFALKLLCFPKSVCSKEVNMHYGIACNTSCQLEMLLTNVFCAAI